ncbi:MAG: GtrA family protein [bacterium]|nr:GtrA family protein [bacterium]
MSKKDTLIALIIGEIVALLIWPVWLNVNAFMNYWPMRWALLIVFPALSLAALWIASLIGRRLAIIWQFAKFGLIGVLNTLLDFGVLNFLSYLTKVYSGSTLILLNVFAFLAANINSYFWNKSWTFSSRSRNVAAEFGKFSIVSVIGFGINSLILWILTSLMNPLAGISPQIWENIAKLAATAIYTIWNFIGYKLIVFKEATVSSDGNGA